MWPQATLHKVHGRASKLDRAVREGKFYAEAPYPAVRKGSSVLRLPTPRGLPLQPSGK